jgi:hypothetical protein
MDSASSSVVAVQGTTAPALISTNCDALAGWTPLWLSCYSAMAPSVYYEQGAFLLAVKPNGDGGLRTNLKGRMNFSTLGTGPGHIITLSDSNFQKTIATANNRPANDANDAFIGYDQGDGNPMNVGIIFGAPGRFRTTSGMPETERNGWSVLPPTSRCLASQFQFHPARPATPPIPASRARKLGIQTSSMYA